MIALYRLLLPLLGVLLCPIMPTACLEEVDMGTNFFIVLGDGLLFLPKEKTPLELDSGSKCWGIVFSFQVTRFSFSEPFL